MVSIGADISGLRAGMDQAAASTTRTANVMESAVSGVQRSFVNLAASVVSVGAAIQSIKGAVQLGDDLKRISDTTGIAVEKLDKLSIAAKLNSTDLDSVAKSFKGLGASMVEAQDGASKSGQIFTALGVSVKDASGNLRGVEDVMGDVAASLNSIENETTRAAVGTELFGKSYLQIAALLRNFKDDQEAANRVLQNFGSVSTVAANLADLLGDQFTLLGEGGKRALLGSLVPGMAAVSVGLDKLIDGGGRFQSGFGMVVSEVATFVTSSLLGLKGAIEVVGVSIAGVLASISTRSLEPLRAAKDEIAKIIRDTEAAQRAVAAAAADPSAAIAKAAAAAQERAKMAAADMERLLKALGGGGQKQQFDAYTKAMTDFAKQTAVAGEELEAAFTDEKVPASMTALLKLMNDPVWDTFTKQQQLNVQVAASMAIGLQQQAAAVQKNIEAHRYWLQFDEKLAEAQKRLAEDRARVVESFTLGNDRLARENALIGASELAHRLLAAQLEYEAAVRRVAGEGAEATIAQLKEELEARKRLITEGFNKEGMVRAMQEQAAAAQQMFSDATRFASDFFYDLFANGSSAFKNLWQSFREIALRALAEIAAKQVVVSIVGALGLGGAGQAGANGFLGTASNAGGLINLGSNAAGGVSSIFGPSSFTAGLAGDAFMPGAFISGGTVEGAQAAVLGGELGAGAAGLGAIAGGAGVGYLIGSLGANYFGNGRNESGITWGATAGAAIGTAVFPVVGTLVGAVIGGIVGSFVKSGGGARVQGFADIGTGMTAEDFGYRTGQRESSLDAVAYTAAQASADIFKALGGKGAFGISLGIDTDPRGTALGGVQAASTLNGQTVFRSDPRLAGDAIGRDAASVAAAISLEAKRAVLGALQASELPTYIHQWIDSVDESSISEADIDNLFAGAQAIRGVVNALTPLNAAVADLDPQSLLGLADAFGGLQALSQSVAYFQENFTTAAEKAQAAQDQLTKSFEDLGLAIPDSHEAFKDLLNSFDLATEDGRRLYAAVMGLSSSFVAVRGTAEQAAQALKASFQEVSGLAASIKIGGSSGPKIGAGSSSLAIETSLELARQQRNDLVNQFVSDKDWAKTYLAQVGGAGGFVQNLANITEEDFGNYSAANQTLIKNILRSQQTLNDAEAAAAAAYESAASAAGGGGGSGKLPIDQTPKIEAAARDMLATFKQLADLSTGNYGRKLALDLQFVSGALTTALPAQVPIFQQASKDIASSIALFASLQTQYGDVMAGSLVQLAEEYRAQQATLAGNAQGLDALHQIFEERWNAIINGTADGVDGTLDQLMRLNKGILDYVDSLKIGAESPLKPLERLAEAQRQYEADLSAAASGDLEARGNITRSADAYIKLARDLYASSQSYIDIFTNVTGALTTLATAGGAPSVAAAEATITPAQLADVTAHSASDASRIGTMTDVLASVASTASKTSAEEQEQFVEMIGAAVYEAVDAVFEKRISGKVDTDKVAEALRQGTNVIAHTLRFGGK